jgi:hypothetical protein
MGRMSRLNTIFPAWAAETNVRRISRERSMAFSYALHAPF